VTPPPPPPPVESSPPPGDPAAQAPASPPPPTATPQPPAPPAAGAAPGTIELNSVSFDELRAQGLSVTQATRLLAHRERAGRFSSINELDEIPGLPRELAEDQKRRSRV
jgi:competence protein ComEA